MEIIKERLPQQQLDEIESVKARIIELDIYKSELQRVYDILKVDLAKKTNSTAKSMKQNKFSYQSK